MSSDFSTTSHTSSTWLWQKPALMHNGSSSVRVIFVPAKRCRRPLLGSVGAASFPSKPTRVCSVAERLVRRVSTSTGPKRLVRRDRRLLHPDMRLFQLRVHDVLAHERDASIHHVRAVLSNGDGEA
jgi:hypothetical protein